MAKDTFGERVSALISQHNLTQREVAAKVGVTEVSLSRYVRGDRVPRGETLSKLAAALQTTPEYLLNREETEDPELIYYRTQRAIARNADVWTNKQKADLVNALFMTDN